MECGFCLKIGERISSPSAVLAQKGLGTLGMTEVMLVCRRKGTGKNALTLTCEQEPAECHSRVGLGWIHPKNNLNSSKSCRVSWRCGFGMDSP